MIICEDIFAIFIYTDIAMMLKLQYSFNKWDSSRKVGLTYLTEFLERYASE